MSPFDINSADSIIEFAKYLKNYTLREICGKEIEEHNYSGKGNYGQILEKFYFGYEPNSDAEPDFKEAGLELKSTPLKQLKNGEYRSKERLVLNIINYLEVYKEEFETSSFWKKNSHLLLVFYLHEKDKDLLDYVIRLVDDWKYPEADLEIIRHDWETINHKIKEGKAHELSEGDTFYLGACTKGSTALKSFRNQPFNEEKAKQRAYSLKQGYVNHIIANIAKEELESYGKFIKSPKAFKEKKIESQISEVDINIAAETNVIQYSLPKNRLDNPRIDKKLIANLKKISNSFKSNNYGKIIDNPALIEKESIEDIIVSKFEKFYGKSAKVIEENLSLNLNKNSKSYFSSLTNAILGLELGQKIEEFEKGDIQVKTVRLKENNLPKEHISFPSFKYEDLIKEDWEDSDFKTILESKFFFVFYQFENDQLILRKVKFWNMPQTDIKEAKKVWDKTIDIISSGNIIINISKKGIRKTNFPKQSENKVSHVRPHAKNAADTYNLPTPDLATGVTAYTKHCFWLNASYIRDEIYLK